MKSKDRSLLMGLIIGVKLLIVDPAITVAQAQLEGPGSGLVAWWKFDEGSGTNVLDSSELGSHTGLLMGHPTRTTGMSGGAIQFNGITDFIRIPMADDLLLGEKTIACWARVDDFVLLYRGFFGWGRGPLRVDNYWGYHSKDGSVYATYLNGDGLGLTRNNLIAPAGTIKLGQWAHCVFAYAGNTTNVTLSFYKNGSLAGTPYTSANGVSANQAMTAIGCQEDLSNPNYVRVFCGAMDDYRIYNRALSATEITNLCNELKVTSSDTAPPSTPTGLTATAASHWQINLSWNASTDNVAVAGYIVYRGGTPIAAVRSGTSYQDVEHTPNTMYAYTLQPSTTYNYTVAAYDAAYNVSSESFSVSATTPANPGGPTYTLTVTRYGSPLSTVTSVPAGLSCGTTCSYEFTSGVSVMLMPYAFISGMSVSPPPFAGWSGDLSGNAEGFLRMTNNKVVNAYYNMPVPDNIPPLVTTFSIPPTSSSLTVPITTFNASDNVGVTGYLATESSTAPLAIDPGWTSTTPASYAASSPGTHTLYAWARDAAGNVSASLSASVTITIRPEFRDVHVAAGNFVATFDGIGGKTYVLEQSTNLAAWSDLQTNGPVSNSGPIVVEETITAGFRFFRLRQLP